MTDIESQALIAPLNRCRALNSSSEALLLAAMIARERNDLKVNLRIATPVCVFGGASNGYSTMSWCNMVHLGGVTCNLLSNCRF